MGDDDRTKDSAMHQVAMKYVLLHIYVPNVTLVLISVPLFIVSV